MLLLKENNLNTKRNEEIICKDTTQIYLAQIVMLE